MKKIITVLFILTLFVGCKKEDNPVPDIYSGTASALKNGDDWNSKIYFELNTLFLETYVIISHVYNEDRLLREAFSITKIKNNFDIQPVSSIQRRTEPNNLSANYFTLTDDGDVLGDFYQLDTTATNNFIQITNYNSDRAEIEGIFDVSFVLNRAGGDSVNPPEKILFSEGKFRVKVEREWFE